MSAVAPIGILGGSFDPVHHAHLAIARTAQAALGLARILWIPGGTPPHRAAPLASADQRQAMLERALAGEPHWIVDTHELHKTTPCYTVETLAALRADPRRGLGAATPLVLLIGADQFAHLSAWHRWKDLLALAHLAVFTRPGWAVAEVADAAVRAEFTARRDAPEGAWRARAAGAIVPVDMAPLDISSTAIRTRIAAGDTPRGLLPDAVLDYIAREGLYAKGN